MRNRCFLVLAVVLIGGVAAAQDRDSSESRRELGQRLRERAENLRAKIESGPLGQDLRDIGKQLQDEIQGGALFEQLNALVGANQRSGTLTTNFKPGEEPFTPTWYARHRQAWQFEQSKADAWAFATFPTVAAWLGIGAAQAGAGGSVYTSDVRAGESAPHDLGLAASGGGRYLPLGVFGLAPQNGRDAVVLVQLAVNENGELRGNYVDVLSGATQVIRGKIHRATQQATFRVGENGTLSFETTLWNLTQPAAPVTLRPENGAAKQVTLARVEKPWATNE